MQHETIGDRYLLSRKIFQFFGGGWRVQHFKLFESPRVNLQFKFMAMK